MRRVQTPSCAGRLVVAARCAKRDARDAALPPTQRHRNRHTPRRRPSMRWRRRRAWVSEVSSGRVTYTLVVPSSCEPEELTVVVGDGAAVRAGSDCTPVVGLEPAFGAKVAYRSGVGVAVRGDVHGHHVRALHVARRGLAKAKAEPPGRRALELELQRRALDLVTNDKVDGAVEDYGASRHRNVGMV